jgi:putative hydrolase of the HAD superfamily
MSISEKWRGFVLTASNFMVLMTTSIHQSPISIERVTTVAFDADDTLWHNETIFRLTEERFGELLRGEMESELLMERLLETERRNLKFYGYGIKGFTLSMIETALEITEGKVSAKVIAEILAAGREMLTHPVETLPGVKQTLETLASRFRIMVITKGDLFDQERKLAESGIAEMFNAVEIVSEKTSETYRELFSRHGTGPKEAIMVGNSLKSDVIPALQAGAWGVHVPYHITWAMERANEPVNFERFRKVAKISQLPALIAVPDATQDL